MPKISFRLNTILKRLNFYQNNSRQTTQNQLIDKQTIIISKLKLFQRILPTKMSKYSNIYITEMQVIVKCDVSYVRKSENVLELFS